MAELENPVIDAEAEALLNLANDFDTKGEYEMPDEKPEADKRGELSADPESDIDALKAETPEQVAERERDERGRFKPKESVEGEVAKPEEITPPQTKEDTAYAKAKKEQERFGKKWQEVEAEKQQVRQEALRLQQREQQIEAERAQFLQQARPRATKNGYSAPDYDKAAQEFAKSGDFENAFKANQTAHELVAYEQRFWAEQSQKQEATIVQAAFDQNLRELVAENPDAAPESGSPLSKDMATLFQTYPYLNFVPEAPRRVAEIAQLRLAATENVELKKRIAEYEKAEADRQSGSRPLRGGPTTPGQPRTFDDLTPQEMERELERASEEADATWGR